jgi:hypothetical protein
METGRSAPARADCRLIDALRHVRTYLEATGLSMAEAHALIGRSILVRYLEDRGVLTRSYFERVAGDNLAWRRALDTEGPTPVLGPSSKERLYDRVLCDAGFTHALFNRLAADFNGDLFALGETTGPVVRLESKEFTFRHSFYCIPLPHPSEDEAKLALGVLWSSLGRYMLFMTAGS